MQITVEDDLDLKKISDSGQCFRWTEISPDEYQIIVRDKCLRMKTLGESCFDLDCSEEEFKNFWFDYLDLKENYANIRRRISRERDEFLYLAAEHENGIRILRQDPWEMLITFIVSQNKNIPAIRRSVEKLAELCGLKLANHSGDTYFAFPTPDALAGLREEQLKDADDEATIQTLTSLAGVGKKVASCVSLFGLHHLNSFPVDVWVKRILQEQYPNGYPFEEYSPYNGIYQQYMFDYYRREYAETRRITA